MTGRDLLRIILRCELSCAVGSLRTAAPALALEEPDGICSWFSQRLGEEAGRQIRLANGGCIKPEKIGTLMQQLDS